MRSVLLFRVVLVGFLLAGGALLYLSLTGDRPGPETHQRATADRAARLADLITASLEHEMLAGDGLAAGMLVKRLDERAPAMTVRLFDHRGIEVWGPAPPAPHPRDMVPEVVATLTDKQRRATDAGVVYRPVANDEACARCHPEPAELRGVLALTVDPTGCDRVTTAAALAGAGFDRIMTADASKQLDDYLAELAARSETIRGVAVYGADGSLAFGAELPEVTPELFARGLASQQPVDLTTDAGPIRLTRLATTERCTGCHDDEAGTPRGLLAIALTPADGCPAGELETLVDSGIRHLMLAGLGRRITDFLDGAAAQPAVGRIDLYDNAGRRYWSTEHPAPAPEVASVLASGAPATRSDDSRVEIIQPIDDIDGCARCHTTGDRRGAIAVSLPAPEAAAARAAAPRRTAERYGGGALGALLVLGSLFLLIRPPRLSS